MVKAHLTEQEVRICIPTMHEHISVLRRNAEAMVRSGQRDDTSLAVQAIARRHRLTCHRLREIWRRVERVVNAIRWQEKPSVARDKLEQQLDSKRDQTPTTEKDKALQAEEVANLEEQLKGMDVPDVDRALVKKYWTDLKVVPRRLGQ